MPSLHPVHAQGKMHKTDNTVHMLPCIGWMIAYVEEVRKIVAPSQFFVDCWYIASWQDTIFSLHLNLLHPLRCEKQHQSHPRKSSPRCPLPSALVTIARNVTRKADENGDLVVWVCFTGWFYARSERPFSNFPLNRDQHEHQRRNGCCWAIAQQKGEKELRIAYRFFELALFFLLLPPLPVGKQDVLSESVRHWYNYCCIHLYLSSQSRARFALPIYTSAGVWYSHSSFFLVSQSAYSWLDNNFCSKGMNKVEKKAEHTSKFS